MQATQARIALWCERASRTVGIAQGLEQAATESFELMGTVLHNQSWDHRLVTKLHDGKLKEVELEPISWQRSQQVEQVESAQGRLQAFMAKILRLGFASASPRLRLGFAFGSASDMLV